MKVVAGIADSTRLTSLKTLEPQYVPWQRCAAAFRSRSPRVRRPDRARGWMILSRACSVGLACSTVSIMIFSASSVTIHKCNTSSSGKRPKKNKESRHRETLSAQRHEIPNNLESSIVCRDNLVELVKIINLDSWKASLMFSNVLHRKARI